MLNFTKLSSGTRVNLELIEAIEVTTDHRVLVTTTSGGAYVDSQQVNSPDALKRANRLHTTIVRDSGE